MTTEQHEQLKEMANSEGIAMSELVDRLPRRERCRRIGQMLTETNANRHARKGSSTQQLPPPGAEACPMRSGDLYQVSRRRRPANLRALREVLADILGIS